jgi:hypothetical protein
MNKMSSLSNTAAHIIYKPNCEGNCPSPCDRKIVFPVSYPPRPPCQVDVAQYAQWHRRMEAIQHAVQSQAYRYLSGFGEDK